MSVSVSISDTPPPLKMLTYFMDGPQSLFLFQHQSYNNIWLTRHMFAKQYLSLYHLQFARFFKTKISNSIAALAAVAVLHAEHDDLITDDLMSNHKGA